MTRIAIGEEAADDMGVSCRVKVEVGGTYEVNWPGQPNHLIFLVLAECVTKTVRVKREEPGWRILVLQVGEWSHTKPGSVQEWVKGANIFRRMIHLS